MAEVELDKLLGGSFKVLSSGKRPTADLLRIVATAFVQAQELREDADYDVSIQWSRAAAEAQIREVEDAFRSWAEIREEPEAERFLALLLGARQRKR